MASVWEPEAQAFGAQKAGAPATNISRTLNFMKVAIVVLFLSCIGLLVGLIVVAGRNESTGLLSQPTLLSLDGRTGEGYSNYGTVHAGSGTWVTKASLDVATSDLSVVASGTTAYLIGGNIRVDNNLTMIPTATDKVWVYEAMSDTFSAGPSLPVASRRGAASIAPNGDIYYAAGRDSAEDPSLIEVDCLFRLVSGAAEWTTLPCMPTPRSDMCSAFVDGKFYVFGGYTAAYEALDSVDVFDTATSKWSTSALKLPTGRGDLMCAALGERVHVVGGYTGKEGENTDKGFFTREHAVFDFKAGTVGMLAPALVARGDAVLVAVKSKYGPTLMYFGGETYSDKAATQITQIGTHHVSEYLENVDVWVSKAPMENARFRFAGAALDDYSAGDVAVVGFGGHTLCHNVDKAQSGYNTCDELASVEAFSDVDLPHIFMYSAKD